MTVNSPFSLLNQVPLNYPGFKEEFKQAKQTAKTAATKEKPLDECVAPDSESLTFTHESNI